MSAPVVAVGGRQPEGIQSSAPLAWHALDLVEVQRTVASGPEGLSASEARRRIGLYGPNALPEPSRRSVLAIVISQLKSPLIYLLLAAAAVAIALGEVDDSLFIFLVLAINTILGAVQEWRAETNTAALRSSITTSSRVRRGGVVQRLDSTELVPGDVVLLEAGDRVPADLRLLHASDLQADESSLTGESVPVDKPAGPALAEDTPLAERSTMLHAGSTVQKGRCEALVVATGHGTELGRIAQALEKPAAPPPLTRRLDRFSQVLGAAAVLLVAVVMALQLLSGASLQSTFFVAIALAVSIIPEGLPVAVTVALSIATSRMARRNVIVRHLPAVEGLGACTVVATDKTGTLTVNQLTAKRLWLPGVGEIEVGGEGYDPSGELARQGQPLRSDALTTAAELARSASLCNDASFSPELGAAGRTGDTVDLAFLVLAAKVAIDVRAQRQEWGRIAEVPFAAERRFSATLNRTGEHRELHAKGAAEVLVPRCAGIDAGEILAIAERMAADGYRVLAVAMKKLPPPFGDADDLESEMEGMRLLGLVGFIDPLRPEAREAVSRCRGAGVAVKMVTGDHAATALAIARELGIAQAPAEVMSGREIGRSAHSEEMRDRIRRAAVFARVEPSQKVDIVEALQTAGHVVAMTGDGVNDAPALRRADLGVAMGRGGTDVAREAADLVLTDDNFASIVAGIEEGRAAYANIRKVIYLLISTGLAEVVLFLLALTSGLPLPLTAVQLLWLNLVTNGGQDVALAFEGREPGLLDRPPRSPTEPIFDVLMIRQTAVSGVYTGVVAYAFFAWALAQGWSEFEARNMLLFLMVAFENAHVFNCRSETKSALRIPLRNNWPLMAAVVGAQAVHIGAAYIPGLRDVLEVAPITFEMWLLLVPITASVVLVMELDKRLRMPPRMPQGR